MGKIDDLISPKVEVTFKGEKYMLDSGFTIEESPAAQLFMDPNSTREEKAIAMKMILKVILKKLFPKATPDEISRYDAKHVPDLIKVFDQLNESTEEDKAEIKKIVEGIK